MNCNGNSNLLNGIEIFTKPSEKISRKKQTSYFCRQKTSFRFRPIVRFIFSGRRRKPVLKVPIAAGLSFLVNLVY